MDTDMTNSITKNGGYSGALGFLKSFGNKGNIQMLTESEIQYVKKLLKEKKHHFW